MIGELLSKCRPVFWDCSPWYCNLLACTARVLHSCVVARAAKGCDSPAARAGLGNKVGTVPRYSDKVYYPGAQKVYHVRGKKNWVEIKSSAIQFGDWRWFYVTVEIHPDRSPPFFDENCKDCQEDPEDVRSRLMTTKTTRK
jgi:hypothetical protein